VHRVEPCTTRSSTILRIEFGRVTGWGRVVLKKLRRRNNKWNSFPPGQSFSLPTYSTSSVMACHTPDSFVTEELQQHPTPSLRSDDQEHRWATTYTRVVTSRRTCSDQDAAYCRGDVHSSILLHEPTPA
jgi:hypothetical protein